MTKYLHELEVIARLNLGKECDIFLGRDKNDPDIVNYLSLHKTKEGSIGVFFNQAEDTVKYGTTLIDEFDPLNMEDEDYYQTFADFETAKNHILQTFGLSELQFVGFGSIVDEYEKMLKAEGKEIPGEIPPPKIEDQPIKKSPPMIGGPPPKDSL